MTSPLTVGSLFSGIGGLELGLERAGMRVVWQVEKDEYCRRVLARHWPEVERFEDVKDVGAHNLKPVDLICGGFPCQDISYAGKGAGLSGERSGLWYEFARIIREMEPSYAVVENVPALLARGLDLVLGTLADIGYDAEWDCVSAESVGAHHVRNRVFIIAYADRDRRYAHHQGKGRGQGAPLSQSVPLSEQRSTGHGRPYCDPRYATRNGIVECGRAKTVADSQGNGRTGSRSSNEGRVHPTESIDGLRVESARGGAGDGEGIVAHADLQGLEGRTEAIRPQEGRDAHAGHDRAHSGGIGRDGQWTIEPDVGRVANGVPSRVDRLRALGNAVVPQVAEYIGRLIVEADKEMRGAA